MSTRAAVGYARLGRFVRAGVIEDGARGVGGTPLVEGLPEYVKADNEHVINDRNGSYIVLGRDRPGSRISGLGHEHGSARVDIVVGRVSVDGLGAVNEEGEKLYVDPSFEKDAARIYISAKANIDDYFQLRSGTVGMSRVRSAVGIKADAVRIIGREGIKLVTRGDPKNSQGGLIEYARGIDLIAGNDDTDLQPMVKGRSLISALDAIASWIGRMNGVVTTINTQQQALLTAIMTHTHLPPPPVGPGLPDPAFMAVAGVVQSKLAIDGTISLMSHRCNGEFLKMNYLNASGRKYILSRYNNTN